MHKYFVVENGYQTPSTLLLTLSKDPTSKKRFIFLPGQYAAISFKRRGRPTTTRCFSIVSSPSEVGVLQFSMRARGRFTKALAELKPGDEVTVRGPFGGFVFDNTRDKNTIMLAGGIGVTPFMSMIRFASFQRLPNKIALFLSVQKQDDIPFATELLHLQKINPNFRVCFVIADGPTNNLPSDSVTTGRLTPEFFEYMTSGKYHERSYLICGPPPFMKAMFKILESKNVSKSMIITEAFSQGPNRQTGKIVSWPLNMYGLTAVSVIIATAIVTVSDWAKTVPLSSIVDSSSPLRASQLTNSRQVDLDSLINNLPPQQNSQPATAAVKALEASGRIVATNSTKPSSATPSGQSNASGSPSPSPTSSPAPLPSPSPNASPSPSPSPSSTPTPSPSPSPSPSPTPTPSPSPSPSPTPPPPPPAPTPPPPPPAPCTTQSGQPC